MFGSPDAIVGGFALGYYREKDDKIAVIEKVPPITDNVAHRILRKDEVFTPSVFIGADYGSFQIDAGAEMAVHLENEQTIIKYALDKNNNLTVREAAGKGIVSESIHVLPTFKTRIGERDSFNLNVRYLRGQFNPLHDAFNYGFNIPISDWYSMEIGNGLAPVATIYHKSKFKTSHVDLNIKLSNVLNYYSGNLRKVALDDSFMANVGVDVKI